MLTANECLRQAEHAEQLAGKATDASSKNILMEIASSWRELAAKDAGFAEKPASYDDLKEAAEVGP